MDSLDNMRNAIAYIEENLDGEIEYAKIAQTALCSQYHFQRMFGFLVGIPLSEYIRRRRLTLAAYDLQNSDERIIDIAVKYGYGSSDAFARAFQATHNITPSKAREKGVLLKAYPRITFTLSLKGVSEMNYKIVEKPAFNIIGIKEKLSRANLGEGVGVMWGNLFQSEETVNQITSLSEVSPFEFVAAYDGMYDDNTTDYYIGTITTNECPENLIKLEVLAQTWAVFDITGPLPNAMGDIWGRIFSEWFPTMGYEHAQAAEIEWYSNGDMSSEEYKSEIWIPVIKK